MLNFFSNKPKIVKKEFNQKADLQFFLIMTLMFFIVPILIIQIPGVERIGQALLSPFNFIINYE